MKKLVMTAAVLTCAASMVSAQTAVTSANIVGYAKETVVASDLTQILPQFLAGDEGGIKISDAFSGLSTGTGVYLWNGGGYDNYVYGNGNWYDANNSYALSNDVIIPQGQGMWMVDGGTGSDALMSGEVPMSSTVTNNLLSGLNMIGNPYPTGLVLSDVNIDNTPLSTADAIYVWNGGGYDNYVYGNGNWYDANNSYAIANDKVIPVGRAFWFSCEAGGDMIFSKKF